MADGLDPLSQMIGALSAQVTNLGSQMVDLRSEILVNRTKTEERWSMLIDDLDEVKAEYRNVKHLERALETSGIAIDERLKLIDNRVRKVEDQLIEWRAKLTVIVIFAVALGTFAGWILQAVLRKVIG